LPKQNRGVESISRRVLTLLTTGGQMKNSKKIPSTGPKTIRGKNRPRENVRRHSLFSRELVFSDADRPDFDRFRRELQFELAPSTVTECLMFDDILACGWRMKQAFRYEQWARQKFLNAKTCDANTGSQGGCRGTN
jgi:hypothetical protein